MEFAEIQRNDSDFLSGGSGDWKVSQNGAKGYILVSMEGIPYWADAVGQIPFALHSYKNFLTQCELSADKVEKSAIYWGNVFASGAILEALKNFLLSAFVDINDNSYDNAMIKRGIKFAHTKYKRTKHNIHSTKAQWLDFGKVYECKWQDTKSDPQLLSLDSMGQKLI
ncbi:hypothetical protein DMC01_09595 [Campylobacter troglodytis]|nr:hypothetical protein DMC01_09595 [Campylobacter troglodytis]